MVALMWRSTALPVSTSPARNCSTASSTALRSMSEPGRLGPRAPGLARGLCRAKPGPDGTSTRRQALWFSTRSSDARSATHKPCSPKYTCLTRWPRKCLSHWQQHHYADDKKPSEIIPKLAHSTLHLHTLHGLLSNRTPSSASSTNTHLIQHSPDRQCAGALPQRRPQRLETSTQHLDSACP
jgi:hypothetical protein